MIENSSVGNYRYLIIGGTTKAATSSLFKYLADHPQICAATRKETRFFLDTDYPVFSKYRFEEGLDKYDQFYDNCTDIKVRLEATPDYLYSSGTPGKIKDSLPNAKMIFILREPISRLVSWYRFAKQNNNIPEKTTFDEYVKLQLNYNSEDKKEHHLLSLKQGKYSLYLKSYFDLFGQNRIHVTFYEDLSNNPVSVIKEICTFAGINPDFYNNYDFRIFNSTKTMKNPRIHQLYKALQLKIRNYTHNKPLVRSFFKYLKSMLEPVYQRFNVRLSENLSVSQSTEKFLRKYYETEFRSLDKLLGKTIPWQKYADVEI